MKNLIILFGLLCAINLVHAQKFWTQNAEIEFYSDAALEKIEAKNNQVSAVLDTETGGVAFSLLMKAFNFEKALMQEHFNEKYVESDKYPKASFKGTITDFNALDRSNGNKHKVEVNGTLTMHGVSQEISTTGTISFESAQAIHMHAVFEILLEDYKISIPGVVKDNIAETIEIHVNANLEPYEK